MKHKITTILLAATMATTITANAQTTQKFNYNVEKFADIEILRYQVPDFETLTLNQKIYLYYLTEAALNGRDIYWDQNGKYNLELRQLLETAYTNYKGDKKHPQFLQFQKYVKQVWFGNGPHHHYSMDKFTPGFTKQFLMSIIPADYKTQNLDTLLKLIFDPTYMPKRVNQAPGQDLILTSACNLYEGVTQQEAENYYKTITNPNDPTPISYGLNSKLIKKDGIIQEQTYKIGGLYSDAITKIVDNLQKAAQYADTQTQKDIITSLIKFYTTGDLKEFDHYSILWADDTASKVDFINGFIENYGDPLGMKGAWESIVNFKNETASERTHTLSSNAQWFEDHAPIDPQFRKKTVKGVSAKVITAAILAGDAYPATPIGINLPNADWIRATHGSKSVTIENITLAYDQAAHGNGFNQEFVPDQQTRDLLDKYLFITDNLHTDLHECLGHGSGQLLPGVDPNAMKEHGSTLEETRADLFALYYLADPKLIQLGLLDNPDAYKAEYYKYILNGYMTQLVRIEPGKNVEEAHMRNRKLIAEWCIEHGKKDNVIQITKTNGKTYIKINDYTKLRDLFGQLLHEIQRIKSTGDYNACRNLVEKYAVNVDPELHQEILDRYSHLHIAPYKGFVNPVYKPVFDNNGNITDINVDYTESYEHQMLRYSKDYSPLTK